MSHDCYNIKYISEVCRIMKYYSEKLDRTFDTEKECIEAEENQELLKAQRKERANEIVESMHDYENYVIETRRIAQEKADHIAELKNKFIEDYGSFGITYKTRVPLIKAPRSIFFFFFLEF